AGTGRSQTADGRSCMPPPACGRSSAGPRYRCRCAPCRYREPSWGSNGGSGDRS
ncbi:Rubredoxin, partial [Dysosmobacter welbionis]